MNDRCWLKQGLVFFFLAVFSGSILAFSSPNVLIFMLDDVGQSDVGAFGNAVVETPNIDKLAAGGMRFTNAFVTTSSCTPSRASVLTGQYPSAAGAAQLHAEVPENIVSLPRLLRNAGYYTASIGKWHLGEPFKQHFDTVIEPRDSSGAVDWLPTLAARPAGKPFFFWFASVDAHSPFDWQAPMQYQDPTELVLPPWATDDPFNRQMMAQYYNEIARADRNIGRVIDALASQGLLENTLVMVLSDNGAQIGGAKTTLYDEGIKTPLVMHFPRSIRVNGSNTQLVSTVDLMPTVLELAGIKAPPGLPGVSLLPTLENPQKAVRDYIYAERNRHGQEYFERAIRTQRFLYKRNYLGIRLCEPSMEHIPETRRPRGVVHEEFYDLYSDPLARQNLAGVIKSDSEFAQDINAARYRLSQMMQQMRQQPPPLLLEQCEPAPSPAGMIMPLF